MTHFLVEQLRFTRSEVLRGLEGIESEEAIRRFEPMNAISWMIGHLAAHEQRYWLERAQGKIILPELQQYSYGQPASTPPLADVLSAWHTITEATDPYLNSLTAEAMTSHMQIDGKPLAENIGTQMLRTTYHYWFHLGEIMAIRQNLGHTDLPQFVGNMSRATYHNAD